MDEINIGAMIHEKRQAKGLSLRKTASLAGITPSMLSQIESDQVNPSLNTLRAIAIALETPLYLFFQEPHSDNVVLHPEERRTIGLKTEPDVRYEHLTPDMRGDIEFCMMIIPPHHDSYRDLRSHEGEEVAYMLSGKEVVLEIDQQEYHLCKDDSVRIPPNARHAWHNRTDDEVKVIFAITPPSF